MITIERVSRSIRGAALSQSGLTRFLNRARRAVGIAAEVEVLFADDPVLRRLNRNFRGKNKPTDVLSFPSPEEISALHAGDLAISLETAERQADAYGHSLRDEVRILLLHGLLHLSGMDHETDRGEMAAREAALRRELRLPNTLIERTSTAVSAVSARTAKKPFAHPASKPARRTKPAPSATKTRPHLPVNALKSAGTTKRTKRGGR